MEIDTIEMEDRGTELMALARMLAFAVETAKGLEVEAVECCLDTALRAVLNEIDEPSRMTLTANDIMLMNRSALC